MRKYNFKKLSEKTTGEKEIISRGMSKRRKSDKII